MADVKWIKITTDIFDDEKVLLIESLPEADSLIVIWFKLLCLAGKMNNSGVFMLNDKIAYTDKMLATIFRRKETTVQLALKTFEQFGMIEIIDGVITIPNWGKHQNMDQLETKKEYMRGYMKQYRRKQRMIADGSNSKANCKTNSKANVSQAEEDIEEEKEIDIDIREKGKENAPDSDESEAPSPAAESQQISFQQIVDLYNSICKSFPAVRSLSDARKKAIKARLNTYTLDDFRTVFENAETSSFLKGSNDRNWSANFDWLIADKNMAKVLEGNYTDKPRRYGRKEPVPGWMESTLGAAEYDAIQRMLKNDTATVGNDPELAERAERLRQTLGG